MNLFPLIVCDISFIFFIYVFTIDTYKQYVTILSC